jgi:hypothetical protein
MSFFYGFEAKSIEIYFTWTEGYFLFIYYFTYLSFDYVRAVKIILKFYFAKANAKAFPIPNN